MKGDSPHRAPVIVRYDYLTVPPPTGHHVWLKLGIDYDREKRLVVVSEEFAPCRYDNAGSWTGCFPYGLTSELRGGIPSTCHH